MNKTQIEWCDYTINPVKGLCPVACKGNQGKEYCYARRMYKRFGWNPEIRYMPEVFKGLVDLPASKIFVGSTIELFGDWVRQDWMEGIFYWVNGIPKHTFIFLTKQPQNLPREFPDNCWVGITITDLLDKEGKTPLHPMVGVKAKVKFISFEPLLNSGSIPRPNALAKAFHMAGISWVIIGQQTPVKQATMPKIEWVEEIVNACDKARIPVFLKDNIKDFIYGEYGGKYKQVFKYAQDGGRELRQEFPK